MLLRRGSLLAGISAGIAVETLGTMLAAVLFAASRTALLRGSGIGGEELIDALRNIESPSIEATIGFASSLCAPLAAGYTTGRIARGRELPAAAAVAIVAAPFGLIVVPAAFGLASNHLPFSVSFGISVAGVICIVSGAILARRRRVRLEGST